MSDDSPILRSASPSLPAAASTAGIPSRNVNRAASARFTPLNMPTVIVLPDREIPGINASACAAPNASESSQVRSLSVRVARAEPLDDQQEDAANGQA